MLCAIDDEHVELLLRRLESEAELLT